MKIFDKHGIPYGQWFRTCDECRNRQIAKQPDWSKELTASYRDRKCNSCHSPALDYGNIRFPKSEGKKRMENV